MGSTSTTSTNTTAPIATTATATTTAVSTVTTTTTVITTTTMTIITHNSKGEAIATDWISHVVLGIIFTCVVSLLLITLTATSCFFVRKTLKKDYQHQTQSRQNEQGYS